MLRLLFVASLAAVALTASAENLLFANLANDDPGERSSITAYCDGNPDKDSVLNCRLVQQSIKAGRTREEVVKLKAKMLAAFDNPKEVERLLELCVALAKPQAAEMRERSKNTTSRRYLAEMEKACNSKDRLNALKDLFVRNIEAEATKCVVPPANEWRARFTRQDKDAFKTDPVQAAICGAISVETIQRKADSPMLWTYRLQRVYMDREDKFCAGMPARVEMVFSWDAPSEFPISCTAVKFGVSH